MKLTQNCPDDLALKIGQMLIVGFRGLEVHEDNPIVQAIREDHLGGVILFDYDVPTRQPERNIHHPEQVRHLIQSLQYFADIPLCVAIDQEGGQVNRLKEQYGFPSTVSALSLGRANDLALTRHHAVQTASTLRALGFTLNFAPVVDLNTVPDNPIIGAHERSFSADSGIVIRHAATWIAAHREQQILSVVKHFPGHGSARDDSHLGWVDVSETWSPEELRPYSALIEAGACEAIMSAHIFNHHFDSEHPATLSHSVLTGMLREQLQYDGLIISDDLDMQAIRTHYDLETAVKLAINAGVNLLTFGNNQRYDPKIVSRVVQLVLKLVRKGEIPEERIEESYRRICRMKEQQP